MKLTFKLVFALMALIILILGIDAYLSVHRESKFLRAELQRKAYRIGNAMKELVADAWRREGPDVALALIQKANARERLLMIRWVWLDGRSGESFRPHASADRLGEISLSEPITLQYNTADGNEYLVTYVSVNVGQRPGALELTEPLSMADQFVRTSLYRKIVLTAILVIGSVGLTLLLGIWLVGWPLKRLIDKARQVGAGDLSQPLELRSRDELSELADTLNQMCDNLMESEKRIREEANARIATIEQLRHADRLRTVGQLASGVAHELGTPLNVVTGRASLISSGRLSPEAIQESAQIIKLQGERMANIIRQLLEFSRSGKSRRAIIDLQMIVRQTTQILSQLSRKHGVELMITSSDKPMNACVDPGQIQQVLTNLVVNAIQASAAGGNVRIGVTVEYCSPPGGPSSPAEYFCLSVDDDGHGIPEEIRNRLFEPFVTTKDIGEGTGLGLSIAYGIVQEHGGWIDVQTEAGHGSQFRVYLPKGDQACQAES